jgi:hypothetical protein
MLQTQNKFQHTEKTEFYYLVDFVVCENRPPI